MDIHDVRSSVAAFNQTLSMIKLLKEGVGIVVCEKCEWVQVLRGGRFHEGGGVLHYRARDIRRTIDPIRSRTQEPDLVLQGRNSIALLKSQQTFQQSF